MKIHRKLLNHLVEKDQEHRLFLKITNIHILYGYFVIRYLKYLLKKSHKIKFKTFIKENQESVWLLVQHCDSEPELQLQYLNYFISNNIDSKYIAYLSDRIGINKNNIQLYGTQWLEDENHLLLYPIDGFNLLELYELDRHNLNKLRNKMNLPDLEVEAGRINVLIGYFLTFAIYTKGLDYVSDKTLRKIRDVSDYKYFEKIN